MRQIIHSYKLRLTNLSQANRSLKLGKLSSRRDIDFKDLGFLEADSPEDLIKKVIAGKDIRLLNRLDSRLEKANLADRRLNKIYREVKNLFEEAGTYDLFVGYPFVEGKFIDETIIRSPVLLFPVRLVRNLSSKPRWKLEAIPDEPVVFNKTLFLAYEQFQQVRLKPEFWDEEIDAHSDWQKWMNDFYQKIKDYEIEMNFNPRMFDFELSRFQEFSRQNMENFRVGKLTFQPQAVLGIFPQSDSSLLEDYKTIESDPSGFDLETYFRQTTLPSFTGETTDEKDTYIREEQRYFVTPVDQSQEEALLSIKKGNSLVIHGPPGTGKSQVIVNIIADAMAHGKKVLLVSQKRAALDVVYKRLGALGLGRFAVLVHDYRHDRKQIYQKIKKQIEDIDQFKKELNDLNVTKWELEFNQLSRQADQFTTRFDTLHTALTSREEFGISAHDLYQDSIHGQETFPLREVAHLLDKTRLESLLAHIRAVYDYRELLADDYPWADRLSFRHYTHDDKHQILGWLKEIEGQVRELHAEKPVRSSRPNRFEKSELTTALLDATHNQKIIEQFNRVQAQLATPAIRSGIEAIYHDELDPVFVENKLVDMGEIMDKMEDLVILKDFSWRLYSDLKNHLSNFDTFAKKPLRYLSLAYLKARWFVKKILAAKQLSITDEAVAALQQEAKLFSALHAHYGQLYEKVFFQDFPLLDTLTSKNQWLVKKKNHLAAYRQVSGMTHVPELHPRFVFGKLEQEKWTDSLQWIETLKHFNQKLVRYSQEWSRFLSATQSMKIVAGISSPDSLRPDLQQLIDVFQQDFQDLKQLDQLLAGFSGAETDTLDIINAAGVWKNPEKNGPNPLLDSLRNSVYTYWLERLEQLHPVLEEVSSRGWNRTMQEYAETLSAKREKVTELIRRKVKESIVGIIEYNRLKNPVTYRQIFHQVTKKRRIWAIRKLIKETWHTGLQELAPVWMGSPESVAAIFPMEKDFFDMVIFDEASQCFVERAIPSMLRGRQSIIAGDEMQLQPFDLYKVKYEDAESEFITNETALEVESILDLAKNTLLETKLSWHYRSQEEALINFSNHAFYGGKLQVLPTPSHNPLNHPALEWVAVQGNWIQNRNQEEATQVVALILELIQRPDNPSIGVVTFNFHQQELIKDLLDIQLETLANGDADLYQKLMASMTQTDEEDFQGIFVKNIENVQGDERDIIIFSVAYAADASGKVAARFGLLNQRSGENRLNVAITRARQKIYVVCSFLPHQLQVEHTAQPGPKYLKGYLQYVKAVRDQRDTEALQLLNLQNETDITEITPNPIADELTRILEAKGYKVARNVGDTHYKIDIAVKSPDGEGFLLAIECEGAHYFSGVNSKEREVYRPNTLKHRGWKWYRVWGRNWWQDREGEVEKIMEVL